MYNLKLLAKKIIRPSILFPSAVISIFLLLIFIPENEPKSSLKNSKIAYLKKIWLHFKLFTIVADQVVDTILVVSLFIMQEYWFATLTCNL
jgi:hypothetical protein